MSFFDWQSRFSSDEACTQFLAERRWPNGFICPQCGHDKAHLITTRPLYQCASCRHQVSVTAGAIFHSTKAPLRKWFWAIYWMASDKGGISALRLSKLLAISWPTAHRMLRKLRVAMGHRDSLYRLNEWLELDDALVGGKRPGKRGRGAEEKTPVLVACEDRGERAGFLAMETVSQVNHPHVANFAQRRLRPQHIVFTMPCRPLANCTSAKFTAHGSSRPSRPVSGCSGSMWLSPTSSGVFWALTMASPKRICKPISMNLATTLTVGFGNRNFPLDCSTSASSMPPCHYLYS